MNDGFVEQDARGLITGWSEGAERLYGWTASEAIGMRSHRLVPERNRARHDSALQAFLTSPARQLEQQELTALHRDGHEFLALVELSIEERDRAPIVAARVRAITRDTRAELAFGPGGERYRAILDQMPDGCCVVDLRGNYLFVNDAFCRLHGFEPREILGVNYKESATAEQEVVLREMYSQVYRTGQPIRGFEYAMTLKNGPDVFVEQSVSLERDARGRPVGFLVITRDCTERKRGQEELAKARDAAEAANRAKSEFLANMSHEIRTPMNGIIGMTALALDSAPSPGQAECLATIRSQANSLLTIVNDILDFSKIESQRIELESLPFTLMHALDEVVTPLTLRAAERGIALSVSVAPDVPAHVVGDPVRIKQILTNLLNNAVKFTERGSVTLEVTAGASNGGSGGAPLAIPLTFRVVDTGIGIPADKLTTIFEPFRQVDGSMSRRFGGTGLGLAIATRLVKLMGGRFRVDSVPGAGSVFEITLPMTMASTTIQTESAVSAAVAAAARRSASAPRSVRVLVAEDNIVNQRVAAGLLTRRGHLVTVVGNGRDAVDAVQRGEFDVVLMDVQMPDMDGFEATAAIREGERDTGRRVRIVAMTAHAMSGDRERCLAAGMDGYLSKPIDQRTLYEAVER